VIPEIGKPIIARLSRCINGKTGAQLLGARLNSARYWPTDPARLSPQRREPPRHWLRPDVAESRSTLGPTDDRKSRIEFGFLALGAAFSGAGPIGGVAVPGT
jgi:hypothetical protein